MDPIETGAPEATTVNHGLLEISWRGVGGQIPARRRTVIVVALLAAVVIALAVLLPFQIGSYNEAKANSEQALRQQATVAVTGAVIELTSPSAANADTYVKDMLARSTGSFKDQLAQIAKTFEDAVRQAGVTATSTVSSSAISKLDVKDRTVSMLVTVVQSLKNKQTPKGEPRYYRLQVKAEKKGDQWLISDMRFVA